MSFSFSEPVLSVCPSSTISIPDSVARNRATVSNHCLEAIETFAEPVSNRTVLFNLIIG
ncbi:Uncharacterised protein [Vibrio cholerae]|nr:Uncharacterised protein [Vibrio cholerae]